MIIIYSGYSQHQIHSLTPTQDTRLSLSSVLAIAAPLPPSPSSLLPPSLSTVLPPPVPTESEAVKSYMDKV